MAFGTRPAASVPAEETTPTPESPLEHGDVVDLAEERRRSGVDEVLGALDEELVGLAPVKARIRQIGRASCRERVCSTV